MEMRDQLNQYMEEMQYQEESQKRARAEDRAGQMSNMLFSGTNNDNLVKWQLDIKEELERIEHLLRKHVPKVDLDGNEYFIEPSDDQKLFNEKGINEILNLLAWYLNKNIILSNFSEEEIKERCKQFGEELKDFIFNNYEEFGLDTKDKIKHYPIVVLNILNTIEAAYNRALNGGERDSLRTARTVTQTDPLNQQLNGYEHLRRPQQSQTKAWNPFTWGR